MRRLLVTALIVLSFALGACAPLTGQDASGGRLPVVASFSVIADLVHQGGGDHVELYSLAGPGVDPHTFNPSPADGAALADARLVFENGAGFEGWLDDLYVSTGSRATRVVLTDGLELRAAAEHEDVHDGEAEHGQRDPHVWHDVANAIVMVRSIRDALMAADPAHQAVYEANAQAYTTRLEELDAWVLEQAQNLPADRRKLVTTHDTFGYFAERYGFEVLGSVLPTSTEGASPSAQQLAALVDAVRAAGVPAIFSENVTTNSLINQVANEAGVQVVASLYTDALGPPGSGAETYVDMLRLNTTSIVTALGS
jgi:ABC-type Zn uptake system ZnuABC Zn-binding protein ZnuA